MSEWRRYRRTNLSEMRPVTAEEISEGLSDDISVSKPDKENGSPKEGDMIARNPNNHDDKWLVAEDYFKSNFEALPTPETMRKPDGSRGVQGVYTTSDGE